MILKNVSQNDQIFCTKLFLPDLNSGNATSLAITFFCERKKKNYLVLKTFVQKA